MLLRPRRNPARIEAGSVTPPVHELEDVPTEPRTKKARWTAAQRHEAEARRALVQAGVDPRNAPLLAELSPEDRDRTIANLKFTAERNCL